MRSYTIFAHSYELGAVAVSEAVYKGTEEGGATTTVSTLAYVEYFQRASRAYSIGNCHLVYHYGLSEYST